MLAWLKDNAAAIGALTGAVLAAVAILQIVVVGPMNQRFADTNRKIDERIGDLRADMNNRFDQQNKYIDARFTAVDQRFDAVDQRFDAVDQRFDAVDQRFDAVDRRLGRLEDDVSELRALSDKVSRYEGRVDFLMEQVQTAPQPAPSP